MTDQSAAPALVFLHGFLGSGNDWQTVIAQLGVDAQDTANRQIHTPDLPGHGLPAANMPEQVDFDAIDRWLCRYLAEHQIQRYLLVGYSLGGRIAMYHGSKQPTGLQGLIVESCHPGLAELPAQQQRMEADQRWSQRFARQPIDTVLKQWYQQSVFADLSPEQRQQLVALRSHAWGNSLATMLSGLSLGKQPDLRPWLSDSALPIFYIYGRQDKKFADIGNQIAQLNAAIRVHPIDDVGHNTHHADPLQFTQILQQAIQVIGKQHD
ncbi:2-succinyl-6-hydroxy-2,4-cyclohexadiene-1-carboxylate synthase [Corallincola holothuriorum]|uniref:Putative 2-succinyl-6-hydroxy-2,4-cyclohexadiene-1-carboxylate synthase n=1 Tax=Corallincola holothuriorum TaxID=2282215 RepID=A0A368NK07_9GAMM|nr:2-succinyl-6-hydroxy-2,4-cyclohexadiene-1-carboxylate synthase [Corallincola holothuriorum]RCU49984.1 2-succinyl-6-hydroxy-2,4-cyclohexadiene-1-carboxylate synthase [Corallincola holothuriorum]